MSICSIRTYQFRNLASQSIRFDTDAVAFVGSNGQGKTSLLEAIYYAHYGRSFRTRSLRSVIRKGAHELAVEVRTSDGSSVLVPGGTNAGKPKIDGTPVRRLADLWDERSAVAFAHEDLSLVHGGSEERRRYLDQCGTLVRPGYLEALQRYRRVVKQRGAALRDGQWGVVDGMAEQYVVAGATLVRHRREMAEHLQRTISIRAPQIAPTIRDLQISYESKWGTGEREEAWKSVEAAYGEDRRRRLSTTGPHVDRLRIRINGSDAQAIASTGQARTISFLLRLSQVDFLAARDRENPVILIDDVFLELDPVVRANAAAVLPNASQVFFTFLPDEPLLRGHFNAFQIYSVADGTVTPR